MRSAIALLAMTLSACAGGSRADAPIDFGTSPRPFGAIAGVTLGMTVDDLAKVAPTLRDISPAHTDYHLTTADADYLVSARDGRVVEIEVHVISRSLDGLLKAWGPGELGLTSPSPEHRYFDPVAGVRTAVSNMSAPAFTVQFDRYQPLAQVIAGPNAQSIAGVSLAGRPIADVIADYKAHGFAVKVTQSDRTTAEVALPETEWTPMFSRKSALELTGDPAGNLELWAMSARDGAASDAAKQRIVATYDQRWGTRVETVPEYAYTVGSAGDPKIEVVKQGLAPQSVLSP